MKEIELKIKHHFDAAHKLNDYEGKCSNIHGHMWNVNVYIKGTIKQSGMVIDFTSIKKEIDNLDHKYLNDILDFNPTAENIAMYLLNQFEKNFPKIKFKVIVWESPTCSVKVESDNYEKKK